MKGRFGKVQSQLFCGRAQRVTPCTSDLRVRIASAGSSGSPDCFEPPWMTLGRTPSCSSSFNFYRVGAGTRTSTPPSSETTAAMAFRAFATTTGSSARSGEGPSSAGGGGTDGDGNPRTDSSTFKGRFEGHDTKPSSGADSSSAGGGEKAPPAWCPPETKQQFSGEVPEHLKHFPAFWNHRQIKQLENEQRHGPGGTASTNLESSSQPEQQRVAHYPEPSLPDRYKHPRARTPGQTLYPAEKEDIAILSESDRLYAHPRWCENATVLRIVRLSDPVVSPVWRVTRNLAPAVRGTQKYDRFGYAIVIFCFAWSLGFWQLERMQYKKNLIELRASRLSAPVVKLEKSPFPWRDGIEGWEYRVIQVRGVFDHKREMWIGPRAQADPVGNGCGQGYLIITPLLLEDGSTILVNRGFLHMRALNAREHEVPGWVQVRGVLEEGEIPSQESMLYVKNEPGRKKYTWLIAEDLAYNAGAYNYEECAKGLVTAYDVFYEEKKQRQRGFDMRRKEDFLLFMFDEHTNFQYALQWFSIGVVILGAYVGRLRTDLRWRF